MSHAPPAPARPDPWEARLRQLADTPDAETELARARDAVRCDPGRPAPLFLLCCQLLRRRDPEAATLLPRLESFPGYAPGWQVLGGVLLGLGRAGAARVAWQRAVAADPREEAAQLGLAAALTALGRPDEAAAALADAEKLLPGAAALPYRRGACLRAAGRLAEAVVALQRALRIKPDMAQAWFALGLVRQDLGAPDGAAAAYRAALAARPDMYEAALNLGIVLQERHDLEAALDAYAACLRLNPAAFGRIAQAIVSAPTGRLWLDLGVLRRTLAARA